MKIVVSGAIGSGKSTVVRAAMAQLGWHAPGGFFTHWDGAGRGAPILYVSTWGGQIFPMARRISEPVGPDGLPYELDVAQFQRVAFGSVSIPGRPLVLDELGLIELGATEFVQMLAGIFHSSTPVIAVIQQRALAAWMRLLGPENVTRQIWVEPATRDELPAQLAAFFQINERDH